ncbi:MAG: WbqC family protein, partial [Carboxydocellales bacterium]
YFNSYYPRIAGYYQANHTGLAELNTGLISLLAGFLGAHSKLVRASELQQALELAQASELPEATSAGGLERILNICRTLGATEYLSGQGAGSVRYMDEKAFERLGITVVFQNFIHPAYSQLWGEFIPNLTILDLLFNHGPAASGILLGRSAE